MVTRPTICAWATVCAIGLCVPTLIAQQYSADDFSRLVKENPLVVAGYIDDPPAGVPDVAGRIHVVDILKNEIPGYALRKGNVIPLGATSNNQVWVEAVIEYEPGQVGVWVLRPGTPRSGSKPSRTGADIVAHFITAKSTLARSAAGKQDAPLEQWGATQAGDQWAVVKAPNASIYTLKGKFAGAMKAGTVLDVLVITNSSSGPVVIGTPDLPMDDEEHEVVFLLPDLNLHPGFLPRVDPRRRALLVQEAEIEAAIQVAANNLIERGASGNPHAAEYKRTKAVYDQCWNRVKSILAKRDRAQGEARMRLIDELRAMKGQDTTVTTAFEAARKKYEAWQAKNGAPKIASPEITALEKQLADIREQIRQLR